MAVPEAAERKAFALTIVGMSLLCVGLGIAAYFGYSETQGMRDENVKLDKVVKDLALKSEMLPQKRKDLKKAETQKDIYENLLPTGKEQVEDLFDKLSAVATDAALEVVKSDRIEKEQAVFGGRQPEQKPYKEIAFEFEFRGTFHELARFISLIENYKTFKRFIAVSNLEITAQSRGLIYDDGAQRHKFALRLATYRYEEKEAAVGADPLATAPQAVVQIYRNQGKTDDEIRAILSGKAPDAAADGDGDRKKSGKIADIFAEDYPHKPEPEYNVKKGGQYRIDPFTFAAGPDVNDELPKLVRKLMAKAQAKLNNDNFDGAMVHCREALALIEGAGGRPNLRSTVNARIKEIKRRQSGGKPAPKREQVQLLIAEATAAFDAGAYDVALSKCQEAQVLIDGADGLLEGERPAADQLYLTAERLNRRRQIEQEFARLNLKISVVAWQPPGSVVVINGRLLREGSRILVAQARGGSQKAETVYVYRILPKSVVFLYRGVKFIKRAGASKASPPKTP